ncbi:metal ABC transporter substrate-binding protein [Dictyoglomus thermophilum]|uniref:Cation ABC transporter, periplasmic cation-binding protein n=2 Tax=Dictyoglomus thermophilum TaxID=14 RepID=B5YAB8_DICT6|nr:zinc ABC transporter substrate-binding protein [Dictyoglomus thermophilum]ACI19827.1 cation ABC transporter, periplasmic cation-binding protein [Dictyoglomus thermophilum H-6-12]MCX7720440.1 metal ABC transporter substrate-binding protein [Dictyoglomus thermophilum]TYT24423.1 zinc ABC transporter substrate-binding protein [Dictyoglomus thermophilum]
MNKPKIKLILTLLLIIFIIPSTSLSQERNIAVSIPPIGSITKYIVGDLWKISVLLPSNTNPHLFEPTPQIMKELEKAKIVVINGKDVDLWAKKLADSAQKDTLVLSDYLKIKEENPHFWLDPILAKDIANIIYKKVSSIDPSNKNYYLKNLNKFNKQIDELNKYIIKELSIFKNKEIIAYHPSFYYFFKRYNIKVLSYIEEGEGKEPSLKKISEIIRLIKSKNIKYIIKEPFINTPTLGTIQKETKVKIVDMDPIGYNKDYFELIKENVKILKEIFYEQNR